jgi:hypothetical protein
MGLSALGMRQAARSHIRGLGFSVSCSMRRDAARGSCFPSCMLRNFRRFVSMSCSECSQRYRWRFRACFNGLYSGYTENTPFLNRHGAQQSTLRHLNAQLLKECCASGARASSTKWKWLRQSCWTFRLQRAATDKLLNHGHQLHFISAVSVDATRPSSQVLREPPVCRRYGKSVETAQAGTGARSPPESPQAAFSWRDATTAQEAPSRLFRGISRTISPRPLALC